MRFPALLAPVLFTSLVFTPDADADEVDFGTPLPPERLDELRGGFNLPSGLSVGFGFERTVTVNGQTVIVQSVTIPDLSQITKDQMAQLATLTQSKTVQIGGATTPAVTTPTTPTASITTPTTSVVTTPTTASVTAPTTPTATSPTTSLVTTPTTASITTPTEPTPTTLTAPVVTTPTVVTPLTPTVTSTIAPTDALTLLPNAGLAIPPGVTATPTADMGVGTLLIQNALDGQTIQAMTTISAAVNTLDLLRDIHFNQSLNDSLRLGGTP